ncbi:unnamed protein product, partial [Rotaria sordida]
AYQPIDVDRALSF